MRVRSLLRPTMIGAVAGVLLTNAGCSRDSEDKPSASGAATAAGNEAEPTSRDYASVAEKVIGQSAGVKEGELVWIGGSDEDLPLLEDLAIESRKRGAQAVVTVSTTGFDRRTYDEVPAKYDTAAPRALMRMAGMFDVLIATENFEASALKGVPPERIAARSKAFNPVIDVMQKRGVRRVFLGNGLYPSAENAEQFGVAREELADMLYGGVDIDYAHLQRVGEEVRQVVAGAKEIRITAPNGTDLRAGVAGQPVYASDGIISPDDQRQGGPATIVWLPAGDVYFTPAPGTAQGVVIGERIFYRGEPVEGLRLEFKAGKLTNMTAQSGLEAVQAEYRAAGAGRDLFGAVDIGINPNLKVPAERPIHAWSRAGMVTVGVGNTLWAGGSNDVSFGVGAFLPNATVMVDDQVLIQDGKLLAAERVAKR